jgi:hypothetical protein
MRPGGSPCRRISLVWRGKPQGIDLSRRRPSFSKTIRPLAPLDCLGRHAERQRIASAKMRGDLVDRSDDCKKPRHGFTSMAASKRQRYCKNKTGTIQLERSSRRSLQPNPLQRRNAVAPLVFVRLRWAIYDMVAARLHDEDYNE